MKKSLVWGLGGVVLVGLALGAYFVSVGNPSSALFATKEKLANDLQAAQKRLNSEKDKLSGMMAELRNSYSLAVSSQDEMKKAANLVSQTNFMFAGATGENPEFLAKNPISNININDERKNVNTLLASWAGELDISSLGKIDRSRSERIRQEIEIVRTYIEHLNQIVGSFTPENSGLSQLQIDHYLAELPTTGAINEILASLDIAINTSTQTSNGGNPGDSQNPSVVPSGNGNAGTNEGTSMPSGTNEPASNSGSNTSGVTPNDVIHQQQVVADAEEEVAETQEQLAAVEEQIEQSNEPVPPAAPTPAPAGEGEGQNENDTSTYSNSPNDPYHGLDKYQGIIVQPGPPQLIQGTNQY